MPRYFVTIAWLVGFALTFGLATQSHRFVYVVSNTTPHAVLYATTFDGGLFAEEWLQQDRRGGTISPKEDALWLTLDQNAPAPLSIQSVMRHRFRDFDYQARAQVLAGPLNNAFGVVFRYIDPQHYHRFYVSSDGYYQLTEQTPDGNRIISTWMDSPAIIQGVGATQNTLRVISRANIISFYVNEQPLLLCIPTDATAQSTYYGGECRGGVLQDSYRLEAPLYGQIGIFIETVSESGVSVAFDDVLVRTPAQIPTN